MASPIIDASAIVKDYGTARALHGVSLQIATGEFVALVGPSGCGKTTLLKILAGFEEPTDGRLEIEGCDMRGVPAASRPTRMVFQKLALFPHKTVADNIGFSLKLQKVDKAEADRRIRAMLDLMHLKPEYLDRSSSIAASRWAPRRSIRRWPRSISCRHLSSSSLPKCCAAGR